MKINRKHAEFFSLVIAIGLVIINVLSSRNAIADSRLQVSPNPNSNVFVPILIKQYPTATLTRTSTTTPTPTRTRTPTRTATPTKTTIFVAVDGQWTGTSTLGLPMWFTIEGYGTRYMSFGFHVEYHEGTCDVSQDIVLSGPNLIVNNEFSFIRDVYGFTARITSPTTATGTLYLSNYNAGCTYLTLSDTWTANAP